jgi:glycosyltransferase involved in cell wall biosynthesis
VVETISLEDLDVLLVKLNSTLGLQAADRELERSLKRAGVRAHWVAAHHPGPRRTMMLTDLAWARAARHATQELLQQVRNHPPRSVIYSTTTAALLWPLPGAIRFDGAAAANRPGRHGLWQRPLERRRLRRAPLLLPSSEGALAEAQAAVGGSLDSNRTLVLPAPIAESLLEGEGAPGTASPPAGNAGHSGPSERDLDAITYAANPRKKGLDRVLEAWRGVRRPGERLVVAGVHPRELAENGVQVPDEDVHVAGLLPQSEYHALLRRARVFVCAPRREEYGLAQLEALAAGCRLVTTPAPGGYVALGLARALDPRLVGEDLGAALRCALDAPPGDYAGRAARLLQPFTTAAVDRIVAEELLPRLLGDG